MLKSGWFNICTTCFGDGNNATGVTPTHTYTQNSPYTTAHSPATGDTDVAKNTAIEVHVRDDGIDITSIVMTVNGIQVPPIITGTPADYMLTYLPSTDLPTTFLLSVKKNLD